MKLIKPRFEILHPSVTSFKAMLKRIEIAGRTCYKSEGNITQTSSDMFVKMLIRRGHESVLEHEKITVRFICDRGVSHELVRHRIASFSQESTRYCNYTKDQFENEITFIIPPWLSIPEGKYNTAVPFIRVSSTAENMWLDSMRVAENSYTYLIQTHKQSPQQARSVLPNSLKTEIVVTANLREWRLILKQRTSSAAHPQMKELMIPLLNHFIKVLPVVFEDIKDDTQR